MKKVKDEDTVKPAEKKPDDEATKTFDAGFFAVSSPVRIPTPHCEGGSGLLTMLSLSIWLTVLTPCKYVHIADWNSLNYLINGW